MSDVKTALVWLRNDLRLADNPALSAACGSADKVVALYVHETDHGLRQTGGAARWWLHQSLQALRHDLGAIGVPLHVETGDAQSVILDAVPKFGAQSVHWNRRYAPAERAVDSQIKAALRDRGIVVQSHVGNLLAEPWTIETGQDKPYSVFTPFWKTLKTMAVEAPLSPPAAKGTVRSPAIDQDYSTPKWAKKLAEHWSIGEGAAAETLADFLDEKLRDYATERDFPAKEATSRLSPHLRFGEISARQIWQAAHLRAEMEPELARAVDKFLSELAWRDFSYHQLYHRDDIARVPMQARYADLQWRDAKAELARWQRGETGFPIIDAGMRQLWQTGSMHNRVRMLVASLLTKNLLVDWRKGEAWFWDCLVDADIANNPASWQWVAGTGLDAAPYFRVFNPVTQGQRFDENGSYIRQWVPELAALPDRYIHSPFDAPDAVLRDAGIVLGKTYPKPIVELKQSRQRALEVYRETGE